jgi:hypothetical protein
VKLHGSSEVRPRGKEFFLWENNSFARKKEKPRTRRTENSPFPILNTYSNPYSDSQNSRSTDEKDDIEGEKDIPTVRESYF